MKRFLALACVTIALILGFYCGYQGPSPTAEKKKTIVIKNKNIHECKKTTVIAVIDTGFGFDDSWTGQENAHLCKFGHKNFADEDNSDRFGTNVPVPVDKHGHGTHIAGLIDFYAKKTNNSFCLVILKYWNPWIVDAFPGSVDAINYARQIHADYINYSGGGGTPSEEETRAVRAYIDAGGTFVAAAGNENKDIAQTHYYPAQDDDRVVVVGNGSSEKNRARSSNYGKRINRWENGTDVIMYNHRMTGTSQAAAIATGKIVAEKNKNCK